MFRRFLFAIGLFAGLIPPLAHAQTSIDAGKSPAEIFSTVCATCHKSARGLANGRGMSGVASFLAEHYTSGKDQAAQLAAYVMGAGGGEAAPATQGRKPASDRAATEEPKPSTQQRQKPEPSGASARLQPPASEESKPRPGDVPGIVQERGRKPATGRREEPATASRGKPAPEPEAKPAAPEPAHAVVEQPKAPEPAHAAVEQPKPPVQESTPEPGSTAAAPANADAGESAPVPRDNIPD